MTDDAGVYRGPVQFRSSSGPAIVANWNGSVRRMERGDVVLNVFPGNEMVDAAARAAPSYQNPALPASVLDPLSGRVGLGDAHQPAVNQAAERTPQPRRSPVLRSIAPNGDPWYPPPGSTNHAKERTMRIALMAFSAGIHADGNGVDGVSAARVILKDSTASANAVFGVGAVAGAARLVRATVTGNTFRDVVSARQPHLVVSTCTTSAMWIPPNGIGAPWGVCTGD